MPTATFRIWRGAAGQGRLEDYTTEVSEGMVVLDAVHAIQAAQAPDLACRWNCKAGKCGSCSAEVNGQPKLIGPGFLVHVAALEMHPLDTEDRTQALKDADGIGYCNITKCCTKVCPESITITDNAIIPLKERVVDRFYDPISRLLRVFKS